MKICLFGRDLSGLLREDSMQTNREIIKELEEVIQIFEDIIVDKVKELSTQRNSTIQECIDVVKNTAGAKTRIVQALIGMKEK